MRLLYNPKDAVNIESLNCAARPLLLDLSAQSLLRLCRFVVLAGLSRQNCDRRSYLIPRSGLNSRMPHLARQVQELRMIDHPTPEELAEAVGWCAGSILNQHIA